MVNSLKRKTHRYGQSHFKVGTTGGRRKQVLEKTGRVGDYDMKLFSVDNR